MKQKDKTQQMGIFSKAIDRPVAISIICGVGVVGAFNMLQKILDLSFRGYSGLAIGNLFFNLCVGLICYYGFWMMRRWAVYTYIAFFILNQLFDLFNVFNRSWRFIDFIIPLITIIVLVFYFRKMK